jgi:Lon protease-like protein
MFMNRAIFPLPVFLLPQGYTRLRIFEDRYMKMVKNAMLTDTGFVLCTVAGFTDDNALREGVYVEIVDFSQDDTGHLLIDVYARMRVKIHSVVQDEMGLRNGDVTAIDSPLWLQDGQVTPDRDAALSSMLEKIFKRHPHIDSLYQKKSFNKPMWVASRWLELLPMETKEKEKIKSVDSFDQVTNFLHTILIEAE